MTEISSSTQFRQGAFSTAEVRAIVVHDGRRGPKGLTGDQGDKGPQGSGFVMKGVWVNGATYCPGDAVTAPSTGLGTLSSLFIQLEGVPCSPSTVEPQNDPTRWSEVGLTSFDDSLGAVWEVEQTNHAFTQIGTPVAWDGGQYVKASNTTEDMLAIAVVREIVDANRVLLQSSGNLLNPDPTLVEGGGGWVDGEVYYLSTVQGFVTPVKPTANFIIPVLKITGASAVVFPFPVEEANPAPPASAPASSHIKLQDIGSDFDGMKVDFPLFDSGGGVIPFGATEAFDIYIDGNAQEPLVNFTIIDTAGQATISFDEAPESFMTFWGVYAV